MSNNELFEAILTAQEEMLKHKIEANSVTLNGRRYGKLIENCPPNMKPTIFGMTRLPNNEALIVCGMMHQLLAINRMVNDDNKTMVDESKEH